MVENEEVYPKEIIDGLKTIPLSANSSLRLFRIRSCPTSFLHACAMEILASRKTLLHEKPSFKCYGKICHQQRSVGFFSDVVKEYCYSNSQFRANPLTPGLQFILQEVNVACESKFDGILVNVYDNGKDYISPHADDEKELDLHAGVVTISVGAERLFRIRDKNTKKLIYETPLVNGSCVQMLGKCQEEFTHDIPMQRKITDWRLSYTLRKHCKDV